MPKHQTRTIENLRPKDETYIKEADPEIMKDEEIDEFSQYFKEKVTPKLLVTTSRDHKKRLFSFMKELQQAIPEFYYYPRKNFPVIRTQDTKKIDKENNRMGNKKRIYRRSYFWG